MGRAQGHGLKEEQNLEFKEPLLFIWKADEYKKEEICSLYALCQSEAEIVT